MNIRRKIGLGLLLTPVFVAAMIVPRVLLARIIAASDIALVRAIVANAITVRVIRGKGMELSGNSYQACVLTVASQSTSLSLGASGKLSLPLNAPSGENLTVTLAYE